MILLVWAGITVSGINTSPDPNEVWDRCCAAMSPPISYTRRDFGWRHGRRAFKGKTSVTIGPVAADVSGVRRETELPSVVHYSVGTSAFDYYAATQLVVDKSALSVPVFPLTALFSSQSKTALESAADTLVTGHECFAIRMKFPALPIEEFGIPIVDKAMRLTQPTSLEFFVDKKSYVLRGGRSLAENDDVVHEFEFTDFRSPKSIRPQDFLPPAGVTVVTPRTMEEYLSILRSLRELNLTVSRRPKVRQNQRVVDPLESPRILMSCGTIALGMWFLFRSLRRIFMEKAKGGRSH